MKAAAAQAATDAELVEALEESPDSMKHGARASHEPIVLLWFMASRGR
jgi:hypothetical protein